MTQGFRSPLRPIHSKNCHCKIVQKIVRIIAKQVATYPIQKRVYLNKKKRMKFHTFVTKNQWLSGFTIIVRSWARYLFLRSPCNVLSQIWVVINHLRERNTQRRKNKRSLWHKKTLLNYQIVLFTIRWTDRTNETIENSFPRSISEKKTLFQQFNNILLKFWI